MFFFALKEIGENRTRMRLNVNLQDHVGYINNNTIKQKPECILLSQTFIMP